MITKKKQYKSVLKRNKNNITTTQKKSYKSYKSKKNTIDNIGLPDEDVFANIPSFSDNFKCYENEYNTLKKSEFNYKKYYKTYESGQQFNALVNIAFKYEPVILSRLLEIVLKRFKPSLLSVLYNIIISKKSDDEIYTKLNKLYRNPKNRLVIRNSGTRFDAAHQQYCRGHVPIQEHLVYDIKNVIRYSNGIKINKYLDVGCGNGLYAISLGKLLKLEKNNIFGTDVSNFSEQGEWGREKYIDKFVFKELELNKPYPFDDDSVDLITMKMVLHHVQNIDFTLKEIKRILKNKGLLVIIEHDSFTYADYMLNDIEHGFYINVFKTNTLDESYLNLTSKNKKKDVLGVSKYYSWPELGHIILLYDFEYKMGRPYNNSITMSTNATRPFSFIFQLNK